MVLTKFLDEAICLVNKIYLIDSLSVLSQYWRPSFTNCTRAKSKSLYTAVLLVNPIYFFCSTGNADQIIVRNPKTGAHVPNIRFKTDNRCNRAGKFGNAGRAVATGTNQRPSRESVHQSRGGFFDSVPDGHFFDPELTWSFACRLAFT